MSFNYSNCTEEELWEFVSSHLSKGGIDTVLVGGGVVCVYTKGAYRSGDIDLVVYSGFFKNKDELMNDIGFVRVGKNFKHPDCIYTVEFPSGPLGIGSDNDIKPDEREVNGRSIKILSPTDCVKDRLASYIYYDAFDCLDQAVLVSKVCGVNLKKIEDWCKKEKNGDKAWLDYLEKFKQN